MSKTDTKQNIAVPRLRFPEFKDSGAWKRKNLGEISTILRGGSPRPIEEYVTTDSNGLNWLKIGDVDQNSKYVTQTREKVIAAALNKTREVNPGDLIMSNSMSFGRPYVLKIKSCIHDGWIAVTKISEKINKDYLYYLILSPESQAYFLINAAGAVVQNLNADIIKLLPTHIPALNEQQKIADCLSSVDELITAQAKKIESLQKHKKGLMQQLFPAEGDAAPKIRFKLNNNTPYPDWQETELKKIAKRIAVKNKIGAVTCVLTNSAADGVVDQRDYFDRDIANKGNLLGYYIVENGDYVYNPRISKIAPVGPISKNKIGTGVMSPLYTVFRFKNKNNGFYEQYFKSTHWHNYLHSVSNHGARHDRMNITNDNFIDMPLPEPHQNEQQKIADCLSSLDELIAAETQKLDLFKTHKKGLMQQLFPVMDEVSI